MPETSPPGGARDRIMFPPVGNSRHEHGPDCAWQPEPRCTRTGHRIARDGVPPRQTRELPVLLWPFELAGRIEARLRQRYMKTA
jgi:hypothetical protein